MRTVKSFLVVCFALLSFLAVEAYAQTEAEIAAELANSDDLATTVANLMAADGADVATIAQVLVQNGQTPAQVTNLMVNANSTPAAANAVATGMARAGIPAAAVQTSLASAGVSGNTLAGAVAQAQVAAPATPPPAQNAIGAITNGGAIVGADGTAYVVQNEAQQLTSVIAFIQNNPGSLSNPATRNGITSILQNALNVNGLGSLASGLVQNMTVIGNGAPISTVNAVFSNALELAKNSLPADQQAAFDTALGAGLGGTGQTNPILTATPTPLPTPTPVPPPTPTPTPVPPTPTPTPVPPTPTPTPEPPVTPTQNL